MAGASPPTRSTRFFRCSFPAKGAAAPGWGCPSARRSFKNTGGKTPSPASRAREAGSSCGFRPFLPKPPARRSLTSRPAPSWHGGRQPLALLSRGGIAIRHGGRSLNTIKTLFLSALLSAAAYGVYVAVTGVSPLGGPKDPPKDWETGPQVVLSEENADQPPAASVVAPAAALPSGNNQAGGDPQAAASGQAPFDPLPQGSHPDGAVDAAIGPSPAAAMNATGPYPSTDPYASAGHDPTAQRYPPDNRSPADRYPSTGDNPPPGAGECGEPPAASGEGDLHAQFAALMQSTEVSLGQGRLAEVHLELSAWYGE